MCWSDAYPADKGVMKVTRFTGVRLIQFQSFPADHRRKTGMAN